jgi:hypothetical protein
MSKTTLTVIAACVVRLRRRCFELCFLPNCELLLQENPPPVRFRMCHRWWQWRRPAGCGRAGWLVRAALWTTGGPGQYDRRF